MPNPKPDAVKHAKIVVALIAGESHDSIASRLRCSKRTIAAVSQELKETGIDLTAQSAQSFHQQFAESVQQFGVATMNMMTNVAVLWSNPDYVKTQKTEDVIAISKHLMQWVERIAKLGQPTQDPDALPERVEAELVDAEPLPDVA